MIQILITGLFLLAQPSGPDDSLTVTQQGRTIATVHREDFTMPLPGTPMVDDEKYSKFIKQLDQKVYREPINAVLNDHGSIVPGRVGYKLYQQAFKEKFYAYFYGQGPSKVEVPEMNIYPKVDSELLSHISTQQLGQYVTYFNSSNKSRSHNISLSAKAIDNHVVFPNETFSFNQVVGMRTRDKGYKSAPIIVKGELSEGVGGEFARCPQHFSMQSIRQGCRSFSAILILEACHTFHPDGMLRSVGEALIFVFKTNITSQS